MEITFNQLVIRLSGYQSDVLENFSACSRVSSFSKNINIHINSCSLDGHMYSNTSQEMLEVDY